MLVPGTFSFNHIVFKVCLSLAVKIGLFVMVLKAT